MSEHLDRVDALAVVPEGYLIPEGVAWVQAPAWWVGGMKILRGKAEIKEYRDACRRFDQRATPALRT